MKKRGENSAVKILKKKGKKSTIVELSKCDKFERLRSNEPNKKYNAKVEGYSCQESVAKNIAR